MSEVHASLWPSAAALIKSAFNICTEFSPYCFVIIGLARPTSVEFFELAGSARGSKL
jgi:hypothetical protein